MAQAECVSIYPDPKDQTGRNVEILLLNPGPLHQLVELIRSAAENGISLFSTDGSLMRNSEPLSVYVPGWMRSSVNLNFEHEGYPDSKIMWFGLEESNKITSMAFVLGHHGQADIMELANMNQSGKTSSPIPYLRGIPCTDEGEVVRVTNSPQPTEEQLRSLAELSIVPEVPVLIQTMLWDIGKRTAYNAFRIVIPETSKEGTPFLKLKKYDASTNIPPLRAAS